MVQRCSSNSTASTFSFFFPMCSSEGGGGGGGGGSMTAEKDSYSFYYPSSTSSVDCTLTLGTPSTRNGTSCMSTAAANVQSSSPGLGWDNIIMTTTQSKTKHPPLTNINAGNLGLPLARRCANCSTTSTPLWRNGPRGPKSLCNACGIRYKKEERRAAASTTANAIQSINGYCARSYNQQQQQYPWSCYQSTNDTNNLSLSPSSQYQNDEDHYLPWSLDAVPPPQFEFDRPTLFH